MIAWSALLQTIAWSVAGGFVGYGGGKALERYYYVNDEIFNIKHEISNIKHEIGHIKKDLTKP
jgi:hypothetical protein